MLEVEDWYDETITPFNTELGLDIRTFTHTLRLLMRSVDLSFKRRDWCLFVEEQHASVLAIFES